MLVTPKSIWFTICCCKFSSDISLIYYHKAVVRRRSKCMHDLDIVIFTRGSQSIVKTKRMIYSLKYRNNSTGFEAPGVVAEESKFHS